MVVAAATEAMRVDDGPQVDSVCESRRGGVLYATGVDHLNLCAVYVVMCVGADAVTQSCLI